MKKETIITTLVGIAMGVIVAFGLITATQEKKIQKKKVITPAITPTVRLSQTPVKSVLLNLSAPENETLSSESSITIKGKAGKDSFMIISSPFAEKVFTNKTTDFTVDFPLTLGENIIIITAHQGKEWQQKTLTVYYFEKES